MASQGGPVDNNDIQFWSGKLKDVASRPAEVLKSESSVGASSWFNGFFSCFDPIDLCLVTWCLPCVTFGKTHHRLHKDADLRGYEPVNTSCLMYCGSTCCGLFWIPAALQRADIRERFNLQGSCLVDLAAVCCCSCCSLVQQSKETAHRIENRQGDATGYENQTNMAFPTEQVKPAI